MRIGPAAFVCFFLSAICQADNPQLTLVHQNETYSFSDGVKTTLSDATYWIAITKDEAGRWSRSPETFTGPKQASRPISNEVIWVDLERKLFGLWINKPKGNCPKGKPKTSRTQPYNACNSFFYRANVAEKLFQAALMCAILACIGGYTEDWAPVLKAEELKGAVLSSGLIASALSTEAKKQFRIQFNAQKESALAAVEKAVAMLRTELKKTDTVIARADSTASLQPIQSIIEKQRLVFSEAIDNAHAGATLPGVKRSIDDDIQKTVAAVNAELEKTANTYETKRQKLKAREMLIIKRIQTKLASLMYYSGSVDGIFGLETETSVKSFFADQGSRNFTTDLPSIEAFLEANTIETVAGCSHAAYRICYSARH